MSRPVISFDVDGVIAGGHYLPEWDRKPERYMGLDLKDETVPYILEKLSDKFNVYIVSGRKFDGALDVTRQWLTMQDILLWRLAGVVVGVPRQQKALMIEGLGSTLHFDDDPLVVRMLGCRGVWYEGREWIGWETMVPPETPVVRDWFGIEAVIRERFPQVYA